MRIGFTGTRQVKEQHYAEVHKFLDGIITPEATEFTTGGCVGFDETAALWLFAYRQFGVHRLCLPSNRKQVSRGIVDSFILPYDKFFKVIEIMPDGSDYKYRNKRIVEHSDILIAVADYPERHGKSIRSGTWQTVRLARDADIQVHEHILNP